MHFDDDQLGSALLLKRDAGEKGCYYRGLFEGIGYVPIVGQLQRYLDNAHAQGFDPEGLKELGRTEGRRVWIGAVDVAAVLRSFYIPAAIFDFCLPPSSNNGSGTVSNPHSNTATAVSTGRLDRSPPHKATPNRNLAEYAHAFSR